MASTYLKRDLSVSETIYKWTWSAWIKRTGLGVAGALFKSRADSNNWVQAYFDTSNKLVLQSYKNGGYHYDFRTVRQFRDTNAWYHFVINVDSSQSTASDRVRIYVNGEQLSNYTNHSGGTTVNNLTNGDSLIFNTSDSGTGHTIGSWNAGTYFDGCMSHVHYSSGYSYAPTVFGSTDATTGEWRINTNPTFTLGGNGYTVLKDGNTITDQSSNSNDFTVGGGTLTKTEDNPSNVFATLNSLTNWRGQSHIAAGALNKGSNTTGIGSSEKTLIASTIGVTSGKWYWEAKSDGVSKMFFGICNKNAFNDTVAPHDSAGYNGIYYYEAVPDFRANTGDGSKTTGIASITSGDVLGFALDMENWALYIHKNGTYMNSGDPTSGASKTGAISELFNYGTWYMRYNEEVFASCYVSSTSGSGTASYNFGNGYFGTTAVSSAGTNASNLGIFEYDVPAGYTALCTKGLNE